MTGFLYSVAEDLYREYGAGVSDLKILLPSRRARLFFTDALSRIAQEPIWEPEWITMDEIMSRAAGIELGDRVRLITELYKIYSQHHTTESFDRFYYWGEILLSDFDTVDKYLIDADMLFRNVADIKELESDLSYLSEQQLRIVAFWSSIGPEEDLSLHKQRFLKVWHSLKSIYHQFRARLEELGIAYSGMIHRVAAERIQNGTFALAEGDKYVIAGFNALSNCEKRLLDELQKRTTARFYWDWDDYYKDNKSQEAGLFISENIIRYPAAKDIDHNNLIKEKNLEVVACSSTSIECKYVSNILDSIISQGGKIDKNTAIVLTDESLLLPLLYALPKYVGKVNVTMGYPLRQTLAYSFVERLLELQHHARRSRCGEDNFYHIDVKGILAHPYLDAGVDRELLRELEQRIDSERMIRVTTSQLHKSELLKSIFTATRNWRELSNYLITTIAEVATLPHETDQEGEQRVEFLSYLSEQITTLHNSLSECDIELSTSIYVSLLRRHLQPLRIPFEGEPLEGLQVMGILETRNLDFENIIILSMNDDNFPGNKTLQPSYIPYNLRAAYELPTPEHHDGVYAYYFYRLIQRSKRVWMLYCSLADEKSTGEQSRYITQLDYESPFDLHRVDVGVDVNLFESRAIEVAKVDKVAEQLLLFCCEHETTERGLEITKLSPTALFQYVVCPLRFYFRSLARINIHQEMSEEIDAPMFGTILHNAMQYLYEGLVDIADIETALRKINDSDINAAINRAIEEQNLHGAEEQSSEYQGNTLLVREVVMNYIKGGILKYDTAHSDFEIRGVEQPIEHFINLKGGARIRLWGICDRIDSMHSGSTRIVDYKSGHPHLEFAGLEALFYGNSAQRQSNIFQTLLYSYMLRESSKGQIEVTPTLFYVRAMNNDDYSPLLIDKSRGVAILNYEDLHHEFESLLQTTLEELFDTTVPFRQCDDPKSCIYCDYSAICRRDETTSLP